MLLKDLLNVVELQVISGAENLDQPVLSACVSDMLSDVMANAPKGCLWITHQAHENVVVISFFKELAGVVLTNAIALDEIALEKARKRRVPVFSTADTAFNIAGKLYALGIRASY